MTAGLASIAALTMIATAAGPAIADTAPDQSTDPAMAKYADQKLAWSDCGFELAVPTECALLTVPRDWAEPASGVDLQVQVSRVVATGEDGSQGIVLTNPGGPGGQGTDLPAMIAELQPDLNARYDLLGMDPRGTGRLDPFGEEADQMLTCDVPITRLPQGPQDARDRSAKSIKEHQQVPQAIAEACQSRAITPYITTWQTAHDMDLLRQLFGAEKLNYIGYSYGSWLGAKYASMFPERAGRMVLDSSVDWQGRLMADFEDFPRMGQRQIDDVFLPWANRLIPEVFGETVTEAKAAIERGREIAGEAGIDGDSYDSLFVGNGSQDGWVITLLVLGSLIDEDALAELGSLPKEGRSLLDHVSKERFGVPASKLTAKLVISKNLGQPEVQEDYVKAPLTRFAVACGDQPTESTEWYQRLSDQQGPRYPYYGWAYGLSEVCGPWTDEPRHELPTLPESVRDNVLLVQGEFDPQTAYEQAMAAVDQAPGVNVVRVDDSPFHGQYAIQGNYCVDGVVNNFLINNSATDNAICSSVPLPLEEKVFPTDGPVDDYLDGHGHGQDRGGSLLKIVDDTVARLLGKRISVLNGPGAMAVTR
ncbi:alpha/beta fold hydrolase [Microlunatus speluncae]|uniref:alpha/beta fold hydrolase n=1 Tax=Microlunatus speluncae TaxID=2594267 RepID=UPI001FEC4329|nr:alpha/beta fold hydrolase [Microlunatus speluncae]